MTVQLCVIDQGPEHERVPGGRDCTGRGNLLSCQLCPKSPTYWRNTAPPTSADPYRPEAQYAPNTGLVVGPVTDYRYWPGNRTKTRDADRWGTGPDAWCVEGCGRKTRLRSPQRKRADGSVIGGVPVHMVCAEAYYRTHDRRPDARPTDPTAHRLDDGD